MRGNKMKYAFCIAVGVAVGYTLAQHYNFDIVVEEKGEGNEQA